jgi:hypothetical protein
MYQMSDENPKAGHQSADNHRPEHRVAAFLDGMPTTASIRLPNRYAVDALSDTWTRNDDSRLNQEA